MATRKSARKGVSVPPSDRIVNALRRELRAKGDTEHAEGFVRGVAHAEERAEEIVKRELTAADASAPSVGADDERFLQLLVIANPKDRFHAMDLRRDQGVAAAVTYLGDCNITDEPYARIDQQDRLHDLLRSAESVCHLLSMDPDLDDVITAGASHACDLMTEAKELASKMYTEGGAP